MCHSQLRISKLLQLAFWCALQLSRLEKYRSRRLQGVEEVESKEDAGSDKEFGTRSKVSLLDQHSELKKKAEGAA